MEIMRKEKKRKQNKTLLPSTQETVTYTRAGLLAWHLAPLVLLLLLLLLLVHYFPHFFRNNARPMDIMLDHRYLEHPIPFHNYLILLKRKLVSGFMLQMNFLTTISVDLWIWWLAQCLSWCTICYVKTVQIQDLAQRIKCTHMIQQMTIRKIPFILYYK